MGLQQPGERLKELGDAFKAPLHSLGAIGSYIGGRVKRQLRKSEFTKVHAALSREADAVADLVHDLALTVEHTILRSGKKIIEKQFHQERMANAAIDIYLAVAVLSRTTWELERAGEDGANAQLDCARIFVPMAARRARRNIHALRRNQDSRMRAIAEHSLLTTDLGPEAPTDLVG